MNSQVFLGEALIVPSFSYLRNDKLINFFLLTFYWHSSCKEQKGLFYASYTGI